MNDTIQIGCHDVLYPPEFLKVPQFHFTIDSLANFSFRQSNVVKSDSACHSMKTLNQRYSCEAIAFKMASFDLVPFFVLTENLNVHYRIMHDEYQYGQVFPNGTASGIFGFIQNGQIDTVLDALSITAERLEVFSFSNSYLFDSTMAIQRKSTTVAQVNKTRILDIPQPTESPHAHGRPALPVHVSIRGDLHANHTHLLRNSPVRL